MHKLFNCRTCYWVELFGTAWLVMISAQLMKTEGESFSVHRNPQISGGTE